MKTKTTLLAALLFAGASQAALAQDHDRGDRGDRPLAQGHADRPAPPAAPRVVPMPPPGGHAPFAAAPLRAAGPPVAPPPGHDGARDGARFGDHRGDRNSFAPGGAAPGDRRSFAPGGAAPGDRRSFAPGGTAPGDRHWDRHDAPREVATPNNGERGWDRDHDGHAGDARRLNRDGRWDRDRHGPPQNWQHWERGRFPPIYAAPHRFRVGPYRPPYGWYVRSWGFGDFLPRNWIGPGYWIDDFYDYDLPWPPPGYHWVRVGPDVLLVDDYSGRIVQVVRDLFW